MTENETVRDVHRRAMAVADEADVARRRGETNKIVPLYREAFRLEVQALAMFIAQTRDIAPKDKEPTRSILCRSAASLALLIESDDLALKWATKGLEGNPPGDVREELQAIVRQIESRDSAVFRDLTCTQWATLRQFPHGPVSGQAVRTIRALDRRGLIDSADGSITERGRRALAWKDKRT